MPCLTDAPRPIRGCSHFKRSTQRLYSPTTLADAVADFRRRLARPEDVEAAFFLREQPFSERLKDAALSRYMKGTEGYKRCGHQRRLTKAALAAGLHALRPMAHQLEYSRSFDDLYDRVLAVAHRTRGLGALWAYDTAERIGTVIGIAPDKIFLHAGTREGAENLGFAVRKQLVLTLREVHARYPEFRKLAAGELESFFCVYKRELARLADCTARALSPSSQATPKLRRRALQDRAADLACVPSRCSAQVRQDRAGPGNGSKCSSSIRAH